ncbi:hypothetical protein [Stenotrophomonas sp. PS02298]|uniref:hypothetical protein n=1 Tax=Stenotrophomonas sp. PS02298 TaxID=2991424 RepID=UPI00249C9C69|nr:hypothetical protein [Stenotrophomonas sp. PS02298]
MLALSLALPTQAQERSSPVDVAGRARLAAQQAVDAAAGLDQAQGGPSSCVGEACTPQALAGRYRIVEDGYAGSVLELGGDGNYALTLVMHPMPRSSKGQWSLDDGMLLLHPRDDLADTVQLVPHEARSAERAQLAQLLADLEQAHPDPADRNGQEERGELQAQLADTHVAGRPLFVNLLDPMSGVASDGIQVVLELAQGELAAEGRLPEGNTYRFPSPAPGQVVTGLRLHFPGMDQSLRLPLQPPLRPGYQVLFDGCAIGLCESATMGLLLEQGDDGARLHALGVGMFQRVNH